MRNSKEVHFCVHQQKLMRLISLFLFWLSCGDECQLTSSAPITLCMGRKDVYGACRQLKHKNNSNFQHPVEGIELLMIPSHKANAQKDFLIGLYRAA